jgi:hypothetical protein
MLSEKSERVLILGDQRLVHRATGLGKADI